VAGSTTFTDASGNGHTGAIDINATFQHNLFGVPGAIASDTALGNADAGGGAHGGARLPFPAFTADDANHTYRNFECWFKVGQLGTVQSIIAFSDNTGTVNRFWMDATNKLHLDVYPTTGAGTLTNTTIPYTIADNAWHYMVLSARILSPAIQAAVYIDGVQVLSTATTNFPISTTVAGTIDVGYDDRILNASTTPPATTHGPLIGAIDEVAIYDTSLRAFPILPAAMPARMASAAIPTSTPYTDVSPYLISGSQGRGRQDELDRMETGTAEVILDGLDRTFDSTYAGSPFVGQLLPARMRLSWTLDPDATLYRSTVLADTPWLYYRCDEASGSLADASGGSRSATVSPTGVTYAVAGALAGDTDTAIQLDGSGSGGIRETSLNYGLVTGAFTVEVWFRRAALGHRDPVWQIADPATGVGPYLMIDTDDILRLFGTCGAAGAGSGLTLTGPSIADTNWHHIVWVAKGSHLLVDGVLVASGGDFGVTYPVNWVGIGTAFTGSAIVAEAGAKIDEFALYRTALADRRVVAHYNAARSTTYTRFTGDVESYTQTYDGPSNLTVDVPLNDGMARLSRRDISAVVAPAELPGARINRILNAAQWPAALRAIDTGTATIAVPSFSPGDTALKHIADVAESDLGYFFVNGSGVATYHDRNHRATYSASPVAFFSDIDGDLDMPYDEVLPEYGTRKIINDVTITSPGGTGIAIDATSVSNHDDRPLQRTTLTTGATEAQTQATLILAARKDPSQRIEQLILRPAALGAEGPTLWQVVLLAEVGDRIRIVKSPVSGPSFSQDFYIEAIDDTYVGDLDWQTKWQLSPASTPVLTGAPPAVVPATFPVLIQKPYYPVGLI
jgi:hypothetical protein